MRQPQKPARIRRVLRQDFQKKLSGLFKKEKSRQYLSSPEEKRQKGKGRLSYEALSGYMGSSPPFFVRPYP
jgi:hypothetical protein